MKKNLFLTAMITLLAAFSIAAQEKTPDFSGSWELDVSRSKLDERARIESMTMNVAQTEKEIKIESITKRAENNNGGMNRGGGMTGGGNQTVTYNLDGKETKIEQDSPMGQIPVMLKAKIEAGKLNLASSRTFNTQMGEVTINTKEIWSLSEDGKTLTIKRETETPRGTQSSEMVFAKNNSANVEKVVETNKAATATTQTSATPRTISGGVLNGKAKTLVKPAYPADAKAAKASGAVNVQVVIDEQGNVISAKAVSGDMLLRPASEEAARQSKFTPTLLEGVPARVTGVIIYNFVL